MKRDVYTNKFDSSFLSFEKDIENISGKLGSICYLEKDYDAIAEEDDEKNGVTYKQVYMGLLDIDIINDNNVPTKIP